MVVRCIYIYIYWYLQLLLCLDWEPPPWVILCMYVCAVDPSSRAQPLVRQPGSGGCFGVRPSGGAADTGRRSLEGPVKSEWDAIRMTLEYLLMRRG